MKKMLIAMVAFAIAYAVMLAIMHNSVKTDMKLTSVGLSWEKDSIKIMERMDRVSNGAKARITAILSIPVASIAINKSGGALPLWGVLGQGIFVTLLLYPLFRRIFKSKETVTNKEV